MTVCARNWLTNGHLERDYHLVLAHGAGAGMESELLTRMAKLVDAAGVTVHRFEFPYMAARTAGLGRKPAPRAETLVDDYCGAIGDVRARINPQARLYIGGKSMGGRIACLAANDAGGGISGVVVLGFPMTPPRKPGSCRGAVIEALRHRALIVQGTRDIFGGREAFRAVQLPQGVRIVWIEDGDHDLKPRRSSGRTHAEATSDAAREIGAFCREE